MTLVDDVITTPRLKLVSLTPSLLRAIARGNLVEVERQLGAPVGASWEEGVPAERRLHQLAADPSEQPWLVRPRRARHDALTVRRQRWLSRPARRPRAGGDRLRRPRTHVRRVCAPGQPTITCPHPGIRLPARRAADRRDRRT